jgi:predicted HTH transcriptional regulator
VTSSPFEETPRQLQALVAYPREDLDRELKGWLDLNDGEHAASLMKAVLALANHGGGFVLIGFTEQQGTWVEDTAGRPPDLTLYVWR